MKTHIRPIGSFQITSGAIVVSDPCYSDLDGTGYLLQAVTGEWKVVIIEIPDGRWKRVAALIAYHVGCHKSTAVGNRRERHVLGGEACVDSGQMSIVDEKFFGYGDGETDDPTTFYGACCAATDNGAGIIEGGCVSCSGYGDGGYNVSVTYEQGPGPCRSQLVNSVRIDFITEKDLRPDGED